MTPYRQRRTLITLLVILALIAAGTGALWYYFSVTAPVVGR
jgi:hypothetical protein